MGSANQVCLQQIFQTGHVSIDKLREAIQHTRIGENTIKSSEPALDLFDHGLGRSLASDIAGDGSRDIGFRVTFLT